MWRPVLSNIFSLFLRGRDMGGGGGCVLSVNSSRIDFTNLSADVFSSLLVCHYLLIILIFRSLGFIECGKSWCFNPCHCYNSFTSSTNNWSQTKTSEIIPRFLALLCCVWIWNRGIKFVAGAVAYWSVPNSGQVTFITWPRTFEIRAVV